MKSLTYAAFITFVTIAAAAAAQPSGTPTSSNAVSSASSSQEPGKSSAAPRRAAQDQVEDRITAQLNRQQLANLAASAAPSPRSTVPQTAAQPSDCAPGQTVCSSGATAQ